MSLYILQVVEGLVVTPGGLFYVFGSLRYIRFTLFNFRGRSPGCLYSVDVFIMKKHLQAADRQIFFVSIQARRTLVR